MSDAAEATTPAAWKTAMVVAAVILCGFALWALRGILAPFVLAIFLLLMIDGVARALQRSRVPGFPERLAMPAALILIVAFFLVVIWLVADNTAQFVGQASGYEKRLNAILGQVAGRIGLQVTPTVSGLFQQLNPARFAGTAAQGVQGVASSAFVVLLYLAFLVASRSGFAKKSDKLFRGKDRRGAEETFKRIRKGVEGYVWVQTVAGLLIAVPAGLLMVTLGLSHAVFWAFLIFVASYVPVIGGAVGTLLPPVFALLEFPTFLQPIILLVGLQAIGFVVGNVIQPRMQGSSLNLDPVAIFLALAFWGLLWGLSGAFLSTPLTVTAMAILAQYRSTSWIAVLLSSDGEPFAKTER